MGRPRLPSKQKAGEYVPHQQIGVAIPTSEVHRLDRIAHDMGINRAELVRRAIAQAYPPSPEEDIVVAGADATLGATPQPE